MSIRRPTVNLGVHISIAGGLPLAIDRAVALGCTTLQIFSRSPRTFQAIPLKPGEVAEFRKRRNAAELHPVVIHTPYVINLASPDERFWRACITAYSEEVRRADALGAEFLVTHVGSTKGESEAFGIARVAEALNRVIERTQPRVTILLENTAGSGQGLGCRFEQIAGMRQAVERRQHLGVCLDTAHTFAAGYPIHTAEGLEETIQRFDRMVGLEQLRVVHFNDSKAPFESKVDRHEHIGKGRIGLAAFRRLANHPALRGLPMILETPKDTEDDDPRNLATVRRLYQRPATSNQQRIHA